MPTTAYFTSAPHDAEVLFVVGSQGEHTILPLEVKGYLSTAQLEGLADDVKAAVQSPSPVEDLDAYMADFQARVVNPPAPAPMTPAEKLASVGLTVDELKALLNHG